MAEGKCHTANVDGWNVSWETRGDYRLWCKQEQPSNTQQAVVVMFNPGSLSGGGEKLRRDTTLRILREIFAGTGYNPYIVNLFSLATPKPWELFDAWPNRDCPGFGVNDLAWAECSAVLYAYGAYESENGYAESIKDRIREIRSVLSEIPEIVVPLAKTGTPKHPMRMQIEGLKSEFQKLIAAHAAANNSLQARRP